MNLSSCMRTLSIVVFSFCLTISIPRAQVSLTDAGANQQDIFPLAESGQAVGIYYDADDFTSIKTSAELFADDVERVTGKSVTVNAITENLAKHMVLVGSLGKNKLIDELVKNNKLSVDEITGGWEQYAIQLVNNPFAGVSKALVVVGSDRRGAAYGLFSISETIGVSPWYWWADVPVKKKDTLRLQVNNFS